MPIVNHLMVLDTVNRIESYRKDHQNDKRMMMMLNIPYIEEQTRDVALEGPLKEVVDRKTS